jgi:hypothetical protein
LWNAHRGSASAAVPGNHFAVARHAFAVAPELLILPQRSPRMLRENDMRADFSSSLLGIGAAALFGLVLVLNALAYQ